MKTTPNQIFSIYRFTNLVNGKIYIGKTTEPEMRRKAHINLSQNNSPTAFHRAIRKYGINSFRFDIIDTSVNSLSEHNDRERHYIAEFNSCTLDLNHSGYNMTRGGDGFDSDSVRKFNQDRIQAGTHNFTTPEWAEQNRQQNHT